MNQYNYQIDVAKFVRETYTVSRIFLLKMYFYKGIILNIFDYFIEHGKKSYLEVSQLFGPNKYESEVARRFVRNLSHHELLMLSLRS